MSTPRTQHLAAARVALGVALQHLAADLADAHVSGRPLTPKAQAASMRLGLVQGVLRDVEQELEREQARVGR